MVFINKKITFLLILALISCASFASAQTTLSDTIPDDLNGGYASYDTGPSENDIAMDMSPENPGAYQEVLLHTSSDYIDLNRYNASWYVDGKKVASGIGERSITFKTRGYGQRTTIIILIQLPDTLIKKTIVIEPQDMTLLWEAIDSYVPPFYEGKKLPARESLIRTIAIPNFKTLGGRSFASANGVYQWKRNDNVITGANGYAKDSLTIKNNKIRTSETVSVTASDVAGDYETSQSITIPIYSPKILFYEKNTRTGITPPYSLTRFNLVGDVGTVVAQPYFFSLKDSNPNELGFNWSMNENKISLSDSNNKQTLSLQNPGGNGTASLGIFISNPNSVFQQAQSKLMILFK
jgi:hypothetical protein